MISYRGLSFVASASVSIRFIPTFEIEPNILPNQRNQTKMITAEESLWVSAGPIQSIRYAPIRECLYIAHIRSVNIAVTGGRIQMTPPLCQINMVNRMERDLSAYNPWYHV